MSESNPHGANISNPSVFVSELEPVAAKLLDRHLTTAKEWFPHELVPYSRGEDFGKGYEWNKSHAHFDIPDSVASALYVNLLTEDNLPYYFHDIDRMFGADGAFGTWSRRWTAEEGRHSIAIRDYLLANRLIDPVVLERGRMAQVSGGEVPTPDTPLIGVMYVAFQELATRIAHRNTGKLISDPAGYDVMSRVAADENLHYLFYKDLGAAAVEADPSASVIAIEKVVRNFAMPGTGIPDFDKHSKIISAAGIYDASKLVHEVFEPVIQKQFKIDTLENLSSEAEQAREKLFKRLERLGRVAAHFSSRQSSATTE